MKRTILYVDGPHAGHTYEVLINPTNIDVSSEYRTFGGAHEGSHLYTLDETNELTTFVKYVYSGTEIVYNQNGETTWPDYWRELNRLARKPEPVLIPKKSAFEGGRW